MYIFFRSLLLLIILIFLSSCAEKVLYSGKIINDNNFDYNIFVNKNEVINRIGQPSYIDIIEKKYYYFFEQKKTKNIFNNKIENRKMIVFLFDNNDNIKSTSTFDLNNQNDIKIIKEKTPNQIIKKGIFQKIFGGVGKSTTIPTQ